MRVMKRANFSIGRTLLLLLPCATGFAIAQEIEGPAPSTPLEEGIIQLDVTVTDKSGRSVTGLGASDFTLMDNGHATRLVSFHAFEPL